VLDPPHPVKMTAANITASDERTTRKV